MMKITTVTAVLLAMFCGISTVSAHTSGHEVLTSVASGGRIPYIEVVQHDDIAQLAPGDAAKARKDYAPDYASIATVAARSSGAWSSVFDHYVFKSSDIVLIPEGVTVTYDLSTPVFIRGIAVKGKLVIDPNKNIDMKVGTIIIYPNGSYEQKPISTVNHKIVFSGNIDRAVDPFQMTIGLITFGGSVSIEGRPVTTFARISSVSGTSLSVDMANGWGVGDSLIFYETPKPNMANVKQQIVKISSIQGTSITLSESVNLTPSRFVAFATRNVTFQSDSVGDRGQMMFLADTTVSVKNVALVDLGRTTTSATVNAKKVGDVYTPGENQIGRYPFHAHHLLQKFLIEGSVVYGVRNEQVLQYPNLSRRVINPNIPLSVYVSVTPDPNGELEPIVWPTAHEVVASSNNRIWKLNNAVGEVSIPSAAATGFAPFKTRIGDGGAVEVFIENAWIKTGWVKYPVIIKDGRLYGGSNLVKTNISILTIPLGSPRWGIANHNSFGDIRNNVVIGAEGSGITTEEGLEFGQIDSNLVIGLGGGTGESDEVRWWGFNLKKVDLGYGGHGFWFASTLPEVTNNIADGVFRFGGFTFYKPYDISSAVPSLNGSNQYQFQSIPGMPEELYGFRGFTSGIRKIDNNVSYAEVGHDAASLTVWNISSANFETTDPSAEITNFTGYHSGVTLSGAAGTLRNFKLYGDGTGSGVVGTDTQYTLVNSQVKNFAQGIVFDRHSVRLIDSVVDNKTQGGVSGYGKLYETTQAKIADGIAKNKIKYTAEAQKEVPNAQFVAVLDHENLKTPTILEKPAAGWATINIDEQAGLITMQWNIHDLNHPNVSLEVDYPSSDKRIPATIPNKLKKVFSLGGTAFKERGSIIVSKVDIETGKYSEGGFIPTSFDDFVSKLKQGVIIVRLITNNFPLVGYGIWPESQGNFVVNTSSVVVPPVVNPPPEPGKVPVIGLNPAVPGSLRRWINVQATVTQTSIPIGTVPRQVQSRPYVPPVSASPVQETNTSPVKQTTENSTQTTFVVTSQPKAVQSRPYTLPITPETKPVILNGTIPINKN